MQSWDRPWGSCCGRRRGRSHRQRGPRRSDCWQSCPTTPIAASKIRKEPSPTEMFNVTYVTNMFTCFRPITIQGPSFMGFLRCLTPSIFGVRRLNKHLKVLWDWTRSLVYQNIQLPSYFTVCVTSLMVESDWYQPFWVASRRCLPWFPDRLSPDLKSHQPPSNRSCCTMMKSALRHPWLWSEQGNKFK